MRLSELEGYDHLVKVDRRHVVTMFKKVEFLREKIRKTNGGSNYDKAELSALEFSLLFIKQARGYKWEKIPSRVIGGKLSTYARIKGVNMENGSSA